jgi:glycogen(starch) synthase
VRGVILVGPRPPPSGGVASHLADLVRAVVDGGDRARVVALPGGGDRAAAAARLATTLLFGRAPGELVHLHTNGHNPGSWRSAAAVAAAATLSGPALLTLHSGLAPAFITAHPATCRRVAGAFRRVLCVSEAIADALDGAGLPRERITIAPAFSARALPLPLPPAGLAAIARRSRPLIAAVAARGPEYGVALLLDGFARVAAALPAAHLVLVGPGVRDASVAARVASLGLGARVHRYQDLAREEALGVIAACDLFVRPTLADGDALSVREALALGRRVLASDAVARPDGVARFRSGDPAALAAAALDALSRPAPPPDESEHLAPVLAVYETLWQSRPEWRRNHLRNS